MMLTKWESLGVVCFSVVVGLLMATLWGLWWRQDVGACHKAWAASTREAQTTLDAIENQVQRIDGNLHRLLVRFRVEPVDVPGDDNSREGEPDPRP